MKVTLKLVVIFIETILSVFSFFWPRNKNVFIFGEWLGNRFDDQACYIFKKLNENPISAKHKYIWITKNKDLLLKIRSIGYTCYHANSFLGWYYCLKGYTVFLTHSLKDVNRIAAFGAKKVMLWHGTPIKKIYADNPMDKRYNSNKRVLQFVRLIYKYISPISENYSYDYFLAPNEFICDVYKSAMSWHISGKTKFLIGFDFRKKIINDFLFKKTNHENKEVNIKTDKVRLLYIPTIRHRAVLNLDDLFASFDGIDNLSISVDIKPHPLQNIVFDNVNSKLNLNVLDSSKSVYELISLYDIIVVDYSSILIDLMSVGMTDNLYILSFDINDYIREEGGVYPLWESFFKNHGYENITQIINDFLNNKSQVGLSSPAILNSFSVLNDKTERDLVREITRNN